MAEGGEDQFAGTMKDLGGKVQDAVGGLTGDSGMQAEGKMNQATGKAQKTLGAAADDLRDNVVDKPLTALGIALGVGVVLGFLARL